MAQKTPSRKKSTRWAIAAALLIAGGAAGILTATVSALADPASTPSTQASSRGQDADGEQPGTGASSPGQDSDGEAPGSEASSPGQDDEDKAPDGEIWESNDDEASEAAGE